MAEGSPGTAILAEGRDIQQHFEGGDVNVVASDQIHGNQFNATAKNGHNQASGPSGLAAMADGNRVDQKFTNCEVNVVGRDQIQGDVHNYITQVRNYITQVANVPTQEHWARDASSGNSASQEQVGSANRCEHLPQSVTVRETESSSSRNEASQIPAASDPTRSVIGNPPATSTNISIMTKIIDIVIGKYSRGFINKLNAYSWKNIKGGVVDNYEDLTDPKKEFHPQMKTGFELFRGDYVPQDGFSAHCRPKKGKFMDFSECLDIIQEPSDKPVMIIGQPGSGKTVLMKRLARALLISNDLPENPGAGRSAWWMFQRQIKTGRFDVILHMNIRDIPNTDDGSMAEVIFNKKVFGIKTTESQCGLGKILEKKIAIGIIFDGLDQAMWEPDCSRKVGPWERTSTAIIFGNILNGHLLGHVPIVVSSREHSVARLPREMRPQFIAALVGFSEMDAKSLYCSIMGEGADKEWDIMRESNPAMHYMCLTPLFLIFYMITRKHDPENPPDCATAVMISILQIFLECENSRKFDKNVDVTSLLQKLKMMAYHGTKEQRVVFTKKDLEKFGLLFESISDIVIQVPGFTILAQKILDGMYRFFFSHQTLQEVLSALHVVGSKYDEFKNIVDEEFSKPYWSVVQSFTSGILKNESVKNRIPELMLSLDPSDSKRKWECLLTHLQRQLGSNISQADKLEIFVALKEANAFYIVRGFAEDLDFSNSPLTPAMINTLCSVMKNICKVGRLSLANSGMNHELLNVLAKGTDGLGIKVAKMDMRGNTTCSDVQIWKRIFENLAITDCFMEIPRNEKNEADFDFLDRLVDASRDKVDKLHFGELQRAQLDIRQLAKLAESKVEMKISELYIKPDATSFTINDWQKTFQQMALAVHHCFVENPEPSRRNANINVWIAAAQAAEVENVGKVSLTSKKISLTTNDIAWINDSKLNGKIGEVNLRDESESLSNADWKRFGKIANEFQVTEATYGVSDSLFSDLPDLQSFADGHRNVKIKRIIICYLDHSDYNLELHLSQLNSESDASEKLKSIQVEMDRGYLERRPKEIGSFIRESSFEEVVIVGLDSKIDVYSFASGLRGFKIKHLAVAGLKTSIVSFVRECEVENLYIYSKDVLEELKRHTKVTIMSSSEWNLRFLTPDLT